MQTCYSILILLYASCRPCTWCKKDIECYNGINVDGRSDYDDGDALGRILSLHLDTNNLKLINQS